MNINNKKSVIYIISIISLFILAVVVVGHKFIWSNVEKIGSMATAIALFAVMYQGYVARKASILANEANVKNSFQQQFNLILEQHNISLNVSNEWVKKNSNLKLTTPKYIMTIRGNKELSPYMRILYHTLKIIKTEISGGITSQKKYTSIVRSFIPNDILLLVAINSSVINKNQFSISDSSQYESYYNMLIDYDFFEHLVIEHAQMINLKERMHYISSLTYNSSLAYYTKDIDLHLHEFNVKENVHIEKFDELLNDVNFYICLAYDLQGKYIKTPDYLKERKTIGELITLFVSAYQKKLSPQLFLEFTSNKLSEYVESQVVGVIEAGSYYYRTHLSADIIHGFYHKDEVIDFLLENINFIKSMNHLIIFRDGFTYDLKKILIKNCRQRESDEIFSYNMNNSISLISKKIEFLCTKLILLKQRMKYYDEPSDIMSNIRKELDDHITIKFNSDDKKNRIH